MYNHSETFQRKQKTRKKQITDEEMKKKKENNDKKRKLQMKKLDEEKRIKVLERILSNKNTKFSNPDKIKKKISNRIEHNWNELSKGMSHKFISTKQKNNLVYSKDNILALRYLNFPGNFFNKNVICFYNIIKLYK